MILVDTSVLINWLRKGEFREGYISVISLIEVLRGIPAEKRSEVKTTLEKVYDVIPLDNEVILEYCSIYEALKRRGQKIPDADLLIAASAKAKNLLLLTLDKEFKKLQEFGIEIKLDTSET
ncbi:MAG: type II toxin-antitoxin system VapC family toxin [Nitrososphaerota archaeon]